MVTCGDELHLLVDERGRQRVEHLLAGDRLAGEATAVRDVLALLRLENLGHDMVDLPGQVGSSVTRSAGVTLVDVALGCQCCSASS